MVLLSAKYKLTENLKSVDSNGSYNSSQKNISVCFPHINVNAELKGLEKNMDPICLGILQAYYMNSVLTMFLLTRFLVCLSGWNFLSYFKQSSR